jgi:hypothetical protein
MREHPNTHDIQNRDHRNGGNGRERKTELAIQVARNREGRVVKLEDEPTPPCATAKMFPVCCTARPVGGFTLVFPGPAAVRSMTLL